MTSRDSRRTWRTALAIAFAALLALIVLRGYLVPGAVIDLTNMRLC